MDRRQFLIGAGSILSTAFISKAEWFLREKQSVVPLLDETKAEETIYFVNTGFSYELRLNTISFDIPDLTYREVLDTYYSIYFPKDQPLRLSDYRELYHEHGLMPRQLDDIADFDWYVEAWCRQGSCNARAYHRLEHLDLFDYGSEEGRLIGGLNFIDGCHPGSDYLGVTADDPLSASLLQARLLELDQNIRVKLVKHEI